jgi:mannosyltransferase
MLPRALLACALLVVAFAARTYHLFDSSIWADDVWSIDVAAGHALEVRLDGQVPGESYSDPWGPAPASWFVKYMQPLPGNNLWRVASDTFAQESHPPLFYITLHFWMDVFGYSVSAGRAFSLLLGLASLPVLFLFAQRMAGETAAWIACFLYALAPLQTQLAIQVRGYTLITFLVLVTTWLTFEILENGPNPKRVRPLIWLGVTGLVTHYYFAIYAFLQGLALLTQRRLFRTAVRVGAIWTAILAALVLYMKCQPTAISQPWMNSPWDAPLLLLNAASAMTDLLVLSPNETLKVFLAAQPALAIVIKFLMVVTVAALLLVAQRKLPQRHAIFLLIWMAAPVLLIYTMDLLRRSGTAMTARYFAGSAFAFYLLLAAGLANLKPVMRAAGTVFLLALMLSCQVALRIVPTGYLVEGYDAKRTAAVITSNWKPHDLVIVLSDYGCVPISVAYYLPPDTPLLSLVYLPRKELGPVVMPMTLETLEPRLEQGVGSTPHLWVARSFPDISSSMKLDAWLAKRYRRLNARRYGGMLLAELELREPASVKAGAHLAGGQR